MDIHSISSSPKSPVSSPLSSHREPIGALAAYLMILDTVSAPVHAAAVSEKRAQSPGGAAPLNSAKEKLGLGWHTINEVYYVVFNGKRFRVIETKRYFTIAGVVVDVSVDKKYTPVSSSLNSSRDQLQAKVLETKDVSAPVGSEPSQLSSLLTLLSSFKV